MGHVKRWGFYLAQCIHNRQMTDQDIIYATKSQWPETYQEEYEKWLLEQIKAVRNNPQIYGPSDQS